MKLVSSESTEECFSFLCLPQQGNRPFLPAKAKAIKGLIPKIHYKLLTNGETVTLDDGTQVTPNDVCGPPTPAQCVAFIFMPDSSYMNSFLDNFEASPFNYYSLGNINPELHTMVSVYHSVPKEVMFDDKYLQLLFNKYGPDVNHILDCADSNLPVFSKSKATFFTDRVKMVCPLMFPTTY